MDRRQFLRAALSLAPSAIILPPAVSYFLPPRGGWPGWQRYSGYNFAELAANPPLVLWGEDVLEASFDLQAFGTSILRIAPGTIHRVPPHEWHTLEVVPHA